MGNCVSFSNCLSKTVGDRDGDGDVDLDDAVISGQDALLFIRKVAIQLVELLTILEVTGADAAKIKQAKDVLAIVDNAVSTSGTAIAALNNIRAPKDLKDLTGDGKVDIKDYVKWYLQQSIDGGLQVTKDVRGLIEEMKKRGVDVEVDSAVLAKVEVVLQEVDKMEPVLQLVEERNVPEDTKEEVSTPKPRV